MIIRQFELDYSNEYDAYVSITRHCYYQEGGDYNYQTTVELPGVYAGVVFAGFLEINAQQDFKSIDSDPKFIKGASAKLRVFKTLNQFCKVERLESGRDKLVFWKMPPSFTCLIKTNSHREQKDAVKFLNGLASNVKSKDLSEQILS